MWAAWGTIIEKRDYLPRLRPGYDPHRDGPETRRGTLRESAPKRAHPHHPLYLRRDSVLEPL